MSAKRTPEIVSSIRHLVLTACAVTLFVAPFAARAAPVCSLSGSAGIAFGTYEPFALLPLDGMGTVAYDCPPGLRVRLELSAGSSGTYTYRTLRSGSQILRYNLYVDAARTQIWGNGTPPSVIGPGVVTRVDKQNLSTIFAQIPAGQDVGVGDYVDTIVVTFNL